MNLLLGPALRLILSSADLRSLNVTVLDQRSSADLNSLIEGYLLILNETALPEVFLALLLLLGLIVGDIGGVAPLVIGVVTLHNVIVLSLLHHLYLVNTFLAIRARSSSSNITEADTFTITSLSGTPVVKGLAWAGSMLLMVSMVMVIRLCVEREGSNKRPLIP